MSGWNSLESVGTLHGVLEAAGLLLAAVLLATAATVYHFWSRWHELIGIVDRARARYAPSWRAPDSATLLHNGLVEIGILGFALFAATEYAAMQYGHRKGDLTAAIHAAGIERVQYEADALRSALAEGDARRLADAAALRLELDQTELRHQTERDVLRRALEQAQSGRVAEITGRNSASERNEIHLTAQIADLRRAYDQATSRHTAEAAELRRAMELAAVRRTTVVESLRWEVKQAESRAQAEISRLQQQLVRAEKQVASLQARRRLSDDEKVALIDALKPYAGQQVSIAASAGDDDGRAYAQDFAEVFDAAGWQHPAVSYQQWDRDPVGVEVTLNETDSRAGRISTGVGALINIVRQLKLVDGNTVFMNPSVPAGQVQLKIGRKLRF